VQRCRDEAALPGTMGFSTPGVENVAIATLTPELLDSASYLCTSTVRSLSLDFQRLLSISINFNPAKSYQNDRRPSPFLVQIRLPHGSVVGLNLVERQIPKKES